MEFRQLPPYSNRGAQNTYESDLIACVDWFQVTLKNVQALHDILLYFNLENSTFLDCSGQYGYRNGITNNGIFFYFNGREDMGIHLQVTGTGCRYLEHIKTDFSWVDFFKFIDSFKEYNITRLDIALDDFSGNMSIGTLKNKTKRGECISKFKKSRHIETINLSDGESMGETLYFGNPSSRLQIRFYEKNHEMLQKGFKHEIESWNRYELQMRKERAQNMFEILMYKNSNDFANEVKGTLNNYLRFVIKGKEKNRSRWKTYKAWKNFIDDVDQIKLTKNPIEKDLLDSYDWLKKQAAPTIAMLDAAGIDINKFVEDGKTRLKDTHIKKLSDYKKESHREMGVKNNTN